MTLLLNGFVRGKDCLVVKCDRLIVCHVKIIENSMDERWKK